jgi:hypothetical protein
LSGAAGARVKIGDPRGQPADQGAQLRRVDDLGLGAEREHVERGGVQRADRTQASAQPSRPGTAGVLRRIRMPAGRPSSADEQKLAAEDTVEAWGRSPANPSVAGTG